MLKRIKHKIEQNRNSSSLVWKVLTSCKDFLWRFVNFLKYIKDFIVDKLELYSLLIIPSSKKKMWISDIHLFTNYDAYTTFKKHNLSVVDRYQGNHRYFYYKRPKLIPKKIKKALHKPYNAEKMKFTANLFYKTYKEYPLDFFYCSFLPHFFTLFSKFDKKVFLNMGFRFDGNQKIDPTQFDLLIKEAVKQIDNGKLQVFSMSHYDIHYFKYFTGKDITLLPPLCNYLQHITWDPSKTKKEEILLSPTRPYDGIHKVFNSLEQWFSSHSELKLVNIHKKYEHYYFEDVCNHKAVVFIPYSVWSGTMYEFLRLGVPLFFPSVKFLKQLHKEFYLLTERKSDMNKSKGGFSNVALGKEDIPDPNDDYNDKALDYWLSKCEFYYWPVEYFDSWEDLDHKLKTANFEEMSKKIKLFNKKQREINTKKWEELLKTE